MTGQTGDHPNTEQEHSSRSKQTLLISIIASIIFVVFLQPIVAFISDTVVAIISVFYHDYIDNLYEQASVGITNAMIFWILSTVLIFTFACMSSLVLIFFNFYYITIMFHSLTKIIGVTVITQQLIEPIESIENMLLLRSPSKIVSFSMVIGILAFMPIVLEISGNFVSLQATATFDRRLMALTPLISDQERKNLLGQWAMMKGRKDYDRLNDQFEELAKQYRAELPKPLI